ncbi:uncharacterized protein BHQ10_008108 [Talaromyces amestolkiae]|uniref:Amine oxidase domain-containing protein n=1 Tax=Talaromyces amestolkiae TaxID=1196081 RepID=A0A364L8G1_TALAM|nr:uncharacterized protein BHQ10_008108 [Talaromyces amestolkiae]RAO72096.1 hypothetical protein BHQ10_008108 [Talaromyces amestolkiae]
MPDKKKRVAVIGAGAAGMSCAATLAAHPDKFDVTVFETAQHIGGQATSIDLDTHKYGASWLNDGVQGGSGIFRHTFNFFRRYGYSPQEVKLQVSFGKGMDNFWTNVFPSPLVDKCSAEIKKLGKVLKWVKYTLPITGILPVSVLLKLCRFSTDFSNKMVLPLLALFLGTGNQTPNVPAGLLERLFDDPNMSLWEYDPDTLLPNLPAMHTFPNLGAFYRDWTEDLRSKGVTFRIHCEVEIVQRDKKKVVLRTKRNKIDEHEREQSNVTELLSDTNSEEVMEEEFDELVLCTQAEDTLKLLGRHATWREKWVLGGARYYNDITVTHSDAKYFQSIFESHYRDELCAEPTSKERKDQISFATSKPQRREDGWIGFQPMYYTHAYPTHPDRIEMGFDCTNYQYQFRESLEDGSSPLEHDRHVFQTIFLNDAEKHLWTIDDIKDDKVIERKWWRQLGHRWQHYLRVVPGVMFINGKNHTLFGGSWTLVNMHEVACVSGIAAAYRLGATYDAFDEFATDFFSKYLLLAHGVRYKGSKK